MAKSRVWFVPNGRLIIDEEAVQSYIRPGGEVNTLLTWVAKDTEIDAKEWLTKRGHVRSGRLVRGIQHVSTRVTGPLTGTSQVYSKARHSIYVHEGTASPITGRNGFLFVPRSHKAPHTNTKYAGAAAEAHANRGGVGKKVVKRKSSVRGQKAKPFLDRGLASSLVKHRLK